jgi:hypothetical protein
MEGIEDYHMEKRKLNNNGSAIVTVLVVTTFITILATTMLYTAAQNYQQKITDYQNKQSFYQAEEALDSLKAALVSDVSDAYEAAYLDTSNQFLALADIDKRKSNFNKVFLDTLNESWETRRAAKNNPVTPDNKKALLEAIKEYMAGKGIASDVYNCIYSVDGFTKDKLSGGDTSSQNVFILKNVRSKKTVGDYTTFLCTDIAIEAPSYDGSFSENTGNDSGSTDKVISLTDCVVYMNWGRTDYYEESNTVAETSTESP